MGPGLEGAVDWSFAYGRASATLTDGNTTAGGADNYWGNLTMFPRRLEARLSPIKWMDLGGQLGWLDGGADVRVGLPALEGSPLALDLSAGFIAGGAGLFQDTKAQSSRWLRLEAYPRLRGPAPDIFLVLALGLNAGDFYHQVPDPRPDTDPGDANWGGGSIGFYRHETRLETSAGMFLTGHTGGRFAGSVLVTVSPYFVLDAGPPVASPACTDCPTDIASYRHSWGVVVVSRFAFHLAF
jgi:hypothetical protein